MSFNTLTKLFDEVNVEETFFYEGNYAFDERAYNVELTNSLKSIGVTDAKCVQQHGGEGQGDKYHSVWEFKFNDTSVFVMFDGWYASYHGSEYTEYFEVEPKEVTVTEYNPV